MNRRLAILFLTLALAGCGEAPPPKRDATQRPAPLVSVAVATVETAAPVLERQGVIEARRMVRIRNQEEGRVETLAVEAGDQVERGQLLVRMDDRLLAAELGKARATLRQAELDLKRIEGLARQKLVSDEERQRAETALAVARAEVGLIEARLAHTRIHAPFAGLVAETHAEAGDALARFSELLTLFDPHSLTAVVTLPETLLATLEKGQTVEIRVDAAASAWLPGRLSRIHPALDPATRLGRAEIIVDRWPAGARPGQSCTVRISGPSAERLLIPTVAVQSDAGGHYVYRLDEEDRIQRRGVTPGISFGKRIEIREGLAAGDRVVTAGFVGLRDGLRVRLAGETVTDG